MTAAHDFETGARRCDVNTLDIAQLAPTSESTGTTKETVARRMLRSREGDVEQGIPITPRMGRVTFEDAADDILNDYRNNKRRSLDSVERRPNAEINNELKVLKQLFSLAIEAGKLAYRPTVCVTPCASSMKLAGTLSGTRDQNGRR